jgi:hypothetical protein
MSQEIITPEESVRLCELERIIQKGKDTFVEVGTALSEIRDSRIYRATFKTFEEYCQKRWDMGKSHVNRMMDAAQVVGNLRTSPIGEFPKTESQARPLAKLPAAQQPAAWEKAQEIAKEEGKPVAARHVEAAVAEVVPKRDEPETVIVDGVEESPTRRAPMKVIESEGMRIWLLAKSHLDRINKNDEFREQALNACIEYCQKRISSKK